jgi:polyisoprenoid-binding protein YceI
MSYLIARGAFALALLLPACAYAAASNAVTPVSSDLSVAPGGKYNLTTSHSQIHWSLIHTALSPYMGRFDKVSGTIMLDPKNPEKSTVDVTVAMNDLDTPFFGPSGKKTLDAEICGEDAFNCMMFPQAEFKSTAIKVTGKNTADITGDLTFHGVTKPLVLHASFGAGRLSPFGGKDYTLGFTATGTLKRSDFGVNKMTWSADLSDDVNLIVSIEARQAPAN